MMATKAGAWRAGPTGALSVTMLLVCGVIAGPLFVLAFLVQGALRPDYDPLRHSISTLALGSRLGWIQPLTFIVAGLLTLAFAVGVRRALRPQKVVWGPVLIGLWAVGLLGAGIFVTDPDAGYPPGSPVKIPDPSLHGVLHNLSAGVAFPALLAACVVFARWFATRGERGWALYSAVSGAVFIVSVVLASYGFGRTEGLGQFGGLFQRISVVTGWGWLAALAVYLLARRSAQRAP